MHERSEWDPPEGKEAWRVNIVVPGRMVWDFERMEGKPLMEGGSKLLSDFTHGVQWEVVSEKQKKCEYWQSHHGDEECVLCGARRLR